ncbi:hypothetical protein [Rapidithrix thailandica]
MYLKKTGVVLLCLLTLVNALVMSLIYADYQLRKEYISKVLCINREKVESFCAGRCFLEKQLEKARKAEQEQQRSESSIFSFLAMPVLDEGLHYLFRTPFELELDYYQFDEVVHSSYTSDIFDPPRISC